MFDLNFDEIQFMFKKLGFKDRYIITKLMIL